MNEKRKEGQPGETVFLQHGTFEGIHTPNYPKLFAYIFETVGDVTLAKSLMEAGDTKNSVETLERALEHLRRITKDFPFEYQVAVSEHPTRCQIR